jgi:Fic family protein
MYRLYLAKGANATTAIEGNTLSEEEVLKLLDGRLKLPPSREYLGKEVDNIVRACNATLAQIKRGHSPSLDAENVQRLNRLVLDGLVLDEAVKPGELREHNVTVGRYRGAPPEDCGYLLARLCEWLNKPDFAPLGADMQIASAILKAVLAHLYLAWIHPFADGNGRTARMVEFEILIAAGVPAVSAHLLSNHYNATRTEYYRQLDAAGKSGGDVVPFIVYAVQGLRDSFKEQIEKIWEQQWDVTWRNYVHESFRDKTSVADTRRRHLALDLSRSPGAASITEIPLLSSRLAQAYARRTPKTLSRDLNVLTKMGLVVHAYGEYMANRKVILNFLPPRIAPDTAAG